eukprot:Rmarinus@m.26400
MTLKFPQLLRFAAEDQMPDDHTCETYKVWNEDPILYVMTCPTVELNKTFDFLENVLKMSRYQAAATITRYRGRLTSETLPSQLDGVLEDVLDLSLHPTRCLCFHYLVETLSLFKRMDDYAVCIREHRKESAKIALADPDALSSTRKKDALEEVERKCEETVLRGIDDIFEWFEAAGVPVGEVERALGIEDVKVETGPADEPAVKKHDDIKEDMCQQLAAERQNIESETIASERADDNDKELGGSGSVGRLESEGASCLGERAEKDKDDSYKVKEGRISYRLRLKIDKKQVPKAIPRFQDVNFFKKRYPVILQALRRQYRETKLAFRSRRLLLVHSWRKVTWRGFEEEVSFESVRVAVGLLMEMGILSYFDIERVLLKVPEMTVRPLQEELSKKMTFVGMIPWCPSASKECSIDHYHRVEAAPKRDVHSLEGVAPCTGGVGCGRCHMGELVCAFPALLDSWASNELPKGSAVEEAQLDWQEPFIHILTKETSVLHACVDVLASEAQLDYRSIGAILSWYPWLPGMGSRAIDAVLDCFSTIGMKPDSRLSHNVLLCLLDLLLAGLEPGTYGFVRRQFREAYAERDNLFDPLEDGGSNNDSEYERELDRQIREEAEKKAGPPPLVFEGVGETTVGRATAAVRFLAEHLGEEDRLLGLTSSIAPKCDTDDNADGDGEENRNECARVENRKPANDHDLQGYTSFFVQIVNLSNMSAESVLTDRIGRGVYRILRRSEWASDASSNVIRHSVRFLRGLGLGTISAILDVYTPAPDLIRIDLERRIQPLIDFLVLYPWPRTVCLRIPPPSRQGVEKTDVITHVHKGTHKRSQLFSARKYPDDDALYCIICRFAALVKQGKLFERAISGKPIKRSDASGSGFSHNGFHVRLLQSDARMTLDPLIAVLMQEGVKSTEEIAKIFVGHPDLFLSSAEDVLDRTEFLRTMGADRVDRLLVTFPKEIFTVDIDRKDERKVAMTLLRAFGASEGEIHELFAEPVQDACVSHSANLSTLLPDAKRLLRECYSRRSSSECANQAMRFQSNTATPDGPREFFDHERHRMVENPNWAMKVKQEKQLAKLVRGNLFCERFAKSHPEYLVETKSAGYRVTWNLVVDALIFLQELGFKDVSEAESIMYGDEFTGTSTGEFVAAFSTSSIRRKTQYFIEGKYDLGKLRKHAIGCPRWFINSCQDIPTKGDKMEAARLPMDDAAVCLLPLKLQQFEDRDHLLMRAGLPHDSFSKTVIQFPLVLLLPDDELRRVIKDLDHYCGGGNKVSGVLIQKCPQIVKENIAELGRQVLVDLDKQAGVVGGTQVAAILQYYPQLIIMDQQTRQKILHERASLLGTLSLSIFDVSFIISSFPKILTMSLENELTPTLRFLRNVFEMDNEELGCLLTKNPRLLSLIPSQDESGELKPSKKFEDRVRFLTEAIGIDVDDVKPFLARWPSYLTTSTSGVVRPVLACLRDTLRYTSRQVPHLVLRHPPVLASYPERMADAYNFLLETGLDDSTTRSVLFAIPSVLCGGLRGMKEGISGLRAVGVKGRDCPGVIAVVPEILVKNRRLAYRYAMERNVEMMLTHIETMKMMRRQELDRMSSFTGSEVTDDSSARTLRNRGLRRNEKAVVLTRDVSSVRSRNRKVGAIPMNEEEFVQLWERPGLGMHGTWLGWAEEAAKRLEECGVPKGKVASVLLHVPELLLVPDTVLDFYEVLRKFGLSKTEVGDAVAGCPLVFRKSPRIDLPMVLKTLQRMVGGDFEAACHVIIKCPAVLGYEIVLRKQATNSSSKENDGHINTSPGLDTKSSMNKDQYELKECCDLMSFLASVLLKKRCKDIPDVLTAPALEASQLLDTIGNDDRAEDRDGTIRKTSRLDVIPCGANRGNGNERGNNNPGDTNEYSDDCEIEDEAIPYLPPARLDKLTSQDGQRCNAPPLLNQSRIAPSVQNVDSRHTSGFSVASSYSQFSETRAASLLNVTDLLRNSVGLKVSLPSSVDEALVMVGRIISRTPMLLTCSVAGMRSIICSLESTLTPLNDQAAVAMVVLMYPAIFLLSLDRDIKTSIAHLMGSIAEVNNHENMLSRGESAEPPVLLGLNEEQVAMAVLNYPQVLSGKRIAALNETVRLLQRYGVDELALKHIATRYPDLLCRGPNGHVRPLFEFFKRIKITGTLVGSMINAWPGLLSVTEEKLTLVVSFLEEYRIAATDFHLIFQKEPRLMKACPETTMRPCAAYLMKKVQCDRLETGEIFRSCPLIFFAWEERRFKPLLKFLREVGLSWCQVRQILCHHPDIVAFPIGEQENSVKEALLDHLKLSKRVTGLVVSKYPALLQLPCRELLSERRAEFLKSLRAEQNSDGKWRLTSSKRQGRVDSNIIKETLQPGVLSTR